jgi:hypothetical protein
MRDRPRPPKEAPSALPEEAEEAAEVEAAEERAEELPLVTTPPALVDGRQPIPGSPLPRGTP